MLFIRDIYAVAGWHLLLLVGVTFCSALLEGLTLAALMPLLSRSGVGSGKLSAGIGDILEASLARLGLPASMLGESLLVVGLLVVSAAVFLFQAYLSSRLQTNYIASWQRRLLQSYFEAGYGFFRSARSGELISLATNEPSRISWAYIQVNVIITSVLYIAIQVMIAAFIAPSVAILVVVFSAVLFVLTRGLVKRAHKFGRNLTAANADFQADVGELISGSKLVKATATERRAIDRLQGAIERIRYPSFATTFDVQIVRAIFEYTSGLFIVVIIAAGPAWLSVDPAAILVVIAMFVRLFPKVSALRQSLQSISSALPSFGAMTDMLEAARRERDTGAKSVPVNWTANGPAAVGLSNVSVEEGEQTILFQVNLEIKAGTFVAVVGPTGAGKTTLLDCILGLRRPSSGRALLDGYLLDELPSAVWRKGIGYLGQDPVLFNASVADNMRWIMPMSTDDELRAAFKKASADFVERLPDGIQTRVGDHGSHLSGGERQRLALARALLGNPRLLVLDEATSALDVATEESVVASIRSLKGEVTIIAITHRPALLSAADFILEMENGSVKSFAPAGQAGSSGTDPEAVRIL